MRGTARDRPARGRAPGQWLPAAQIRAHARGTGMPGPLLPGARCARAVAPPALPRSAAPDPGPAGIGPSPRTTHAAVLSPPLPPAPAGTAPASPATAAPDEIGRA